MLRLLLAGLQLGAAAGPEDHHCAAGRHGNARLAAGAHHLRPVHPGGRHRVRHRAAAAHLQSVRAALQRLRVGRGPPRGLDPPPRRRGIGLRVPPVHPLPVLRPQLRPVVSLSHVRHALFVRDHRGRVRGHALPVSGQGRLADLGRAQSVLQNPEVSSSNRVGD